MINNNLFLERESIKVLDECKELQENKGSDYHNNLSTVKQAHYYPNGCMTILDLINIKALRIRSILETIQTNNKISNPNFESLEDSFKDLINYASFGVSFLRGKMEGQNLDKNILNKDFKND